MRWTAASRSAVQEAVAGHINKFNVEYVSCGSLVDFQEGIFKDRPEVFTALPKGIDNEPSILVLLANSTSQHHKARHLIILAVMPSAQNLELQKLIPLDISPLPVASDHADQGPTSYEVDVQAGQLMELAGENLSIYDIRGAVPKNKSTVQLGGPGSFTRLSRPFLLSASSDTLFMYNHQYRSVHAKAPLDLSELPQEGQGARSCQLITFLRSQDLVVALVDNVLVSIQVEPPSSHGKRRKEGLLIDSIGRGATVDIHSRKRVKGDVTTSEFSRLMPGTMTKAYMAKYHKETNAADKLLAAHEFAEWDEMLRKKFGLKKHDGGNSAGSQEVPEWDWETIDGSYPVADRRWILYAISQVFSVDATTAEHPVPVLRILLPDSNILTYLVVAGHLTMSNVLSAFRDEITVDSKGVAGLAGSLIHTLTEADPSMTLLLNYLQATKLGEAEILLAVRKLMLSMDLLRDTNKLNKMKLLASEAHDDKDEYEMDLDELEREIAVTEHYLGDEDSSRSRGLTLAFAKLWRLPAASTVKALRETLQTEEIVTLIYLLRVELVRGAWTSLYIDPTSFESEGNDPPPDGVIALIADLLGRCLDAVGPGGWLFNDAMTWDDKAAAGDFLTALRNEVTAALEGIQEAVYLNGVVGETARYGLTAENSWATRQAWNAARPISMQIDGRESRLLPLGLKAKMLPTKDKVVSGGEVLQRSNRETGHLISQKVEAYSLERLAI